MSTSGKTASYGDSDYVMFREFVESSQELFWTVDVQGCFRYLNSSWEGLLGMPRSQLIGRKFDDLRTEAVGENSQGFLAMCQSQPRFSNYEATFTRRDGTLAVAVFSGKCVFSDGGAPAGYLGVGIEITKRRQAENDLRISEERYRMLSDSAFEGIMIHENGRILDMNQAFVSMFGFDSKSEMMDINTFATIIAPRSQAMIRSRIQNDLTGPAEVYCLRRSGEEFVGMTQSRTIMFGGRAARIVTMTDITESKRAAVALAEEKERLAVTLRSIGDGVIATDTQGRVMVLNAVAENLTGWSQDEAMGKPLKDVFKIIHEFTRNSCENPVDRVLATGEIIELANHTVLISRDGTERIIEDSGAPIRNGEGQTIGVVLVFRDTTEKTRLSEAAQRTQKLESLGILAGGIAHDFNNLLGGIFGYIDLVHAKTEDKQNAHYLEKALSTIERARALTLQLLTFAKGGTPIRKVSLLFPLVEETVNFVLSGSAIDCRFDIAPGLDACDFDRNQFAQVVDNLVINALQAMPMGGNLVVTAENVALRNGQHGGLPSGRYVHLSFRDSGMGIPAENLPRIFDPFFTTKQKGSGLGLATCFSILKQHDGSIEVESEAGQGTTFHLYLPASAQAVSGGAEAPMSPIYGHGRFIVMDDVEVIREITGEMLRRMGFEPVVFAEGSALIDYLKKQDPDLSGIAGVLLDLTIPGGMGGKDVIIEIRKISSKLPIFVCSGYTDDSIMASPQSHGITGSIEKPFRLAGLMDLLKKHL